MAGRRLKLVDDTASRERAPDLRDSVREAINNMNWLTDSDQGMVTLALRQSEEIEKAIDRAEELEAIVREAGGDPDIYKRLKKLEAMCDITKTVGWLGPQLQGVLRDLGGAPKARAEMKQDKPIGGRLADIRSRAKAKSAGEDDS